MDERVLRVRKGVEAYTELTIVGYRGVAAHTPFVPQGRATHFIP